MKKFIKRRLTILAYGALAGLLIGQAGQLFWVFDLFSHFTVLYAGILLLGVWAAPQQSARIVFGATAAVLLTWLLWSPPEEISKPAFRKFLTYNLLLDNTRQQENAIWLQAFDADVMFLSEYTPAWQQTLKPLAAVYPHRCERAEDSPFGLALYSKQPVQCAVISLEGEAADYPYVRAELSDGRVVYGIHPPPPIGEMLSNARDASLQQLAGRIRAENAEVLVLGDMNSTPFSPVFRSFLRTAGLQLASPRWKPTWRPGYLPIDHILTRGGGASAYAEDWRGSDHRPLWVRW